MSNYIERLNNDEIEALLDEDFEPGRFYQALSNALTQLENLQLDNTQTDGYDLEVA